MRLLEKHATSIVGEKQSLLARAVVPFDINAVTAWSFSQPQLDMPLRRQFPCVIAPHPVTFYEYKLPACWQTEDQNTGTFSRTKAKHGASDYFGMLIVQEAFDPSEQVKGLDLSAAAFKQHTFMVNGDASSCGRLLHADNYVDRDGRLIGGVIRDAHLSISANASVEAAAAVVVKAYCTPVYFALSLIAAQKAKIRQNSAPVRNLQKQGRGTCVYRQVTVKKFRRSVGDSIPDALLHVTSGWESKTATAYGTPSANDTWIAEALKTYKLVVK